ncbi:hypothetical protein HSBAA_09990 [Vreelandella sulfidaeris]|uniref:AB hydrolase-1 domain-containing protein n=1 Tax=Vreelandella sulfidaeris TaxID=115553 RepID=A0A455U3D0_9GAMM|nr:hypothetical protein HSBAA_09990 [Halomonas sulfidaeris]
MWRDVIEALACEYHVVAPDLPGFGFTESPARGQYEYTFANLAKTIDQFTDQLKLDRYAIAVHDYGAPVGWRLAVAHPSKITAIISQNGNAYEEGLSQGWEPIQTYWNDPSKANRDALSDFPTPASIKWQYLEGKRHKCGSTGCLYVGRGSYLSTWDGGYSARLIVGLRHQRCEVSRISGLFSGVSAAVARRMGKA